MHKFVRVVRMRLEIKGALAVVVMVSLGTSTRGWQSTCVTPEQQSEEGRLTAQRRPVPQLGFPSTHALGY